MLSRIFSEYFPELSQYFRPENLWKKAKFLSVNDVTRFHKRYLTTKNVFKTLNHNKKQLQLLNYQQKGAALQHVLDSSSSENIGKFLGCFLVNLTLKSHVIIHSVSKIFRKATFLQHDKSIREYKWVSRQLP